MQATDFLNDIPTRLATSAFSGTSFTPEKRGESYRNDYAQTMASDYAELAKHAEIGKTTEQLAEHFGRYKAGYATRYRAWLASQGRCISWMITGPARFPTGRAQKWNVAAQNRMQALIEYRETVKRAILRKLRPDLRPIMAGDVDAIDRLAVKLSHLEADQERMKKANAAIRKYAKQGQEAQIIALAELGFSREASEGLLNPPHWRGVGFASYSLTNNNANIRRTRERLEQLERNAAKPIQTVQAEGVRIEQDPPANRVRLYFDEKPDYSTRDKLKAGGFRCAPSTGAWQAYNNNRAVELARSFIAQPAAV
jgi:hypothetical protein